MKGKAIVLLIATMFIAIQCNSSTDNVRPTNLSCEYLQNPLGIDVLNPRLSWISKSEQRGWKQSAYHILVASTKENLENNIGDLWDSGIVESDRSVQVAYSGQELRSKMFCYWKVCVWDKEGERSNWSKPAMWSMGLLNPSDWKAKWIGSNSADPTDVKDAAILFRKDVTLYKKPVKVIAHVSGLGLYEMFINGKRVGDHVLDPTDTDYNIRVKYVTYDVTDHFEEGENTIGVIVGNGWYDINFRDVWEFETAPWIAPKKLLLQIEIEYSDGSRESIATDKTWKWSTGAITYNSIRGGETIDARRVKIDWDKPGYNDTDWNSVKILSAPLGHLSAQMNVPIRVKGLIKPVKLMQPHPGIYVFDMGLNFSGWAKMKVSGKAGQKITLKFNEVLNDAGTVDTNHVNSSYTFGRYQTGELILSGNGVDVYEPRFTYHGFQYVQVEGLTKKPNLDDLTGVMVYTDAESRGSFSCSNEKFNQLQKVFRHSALNYTHHRPRDPAREKLGWTQDAWQLEEMGFYNFDYVTNYRLWFQDMLDEQEPNGHIPPVDPTAGWGKLGTEGAKYSDPWWGGALIYGSWKLYQFFDDKRLLEENYDGMKKFVDYIGTTTNNNIIDWHLGDWGEVGTMGGPKRTPKEQTCTSGYYLLTDILARTASVIGKDNDAKKYTKLAGEIRDSFNEKFLNTNTGVYAVNSQTSQVLPLYLGMVPEEKEQLVLKQLLKSVEERNNHLSTGFVGTMALMLGLSDLGYAELAYTIANQEDEPSWWGSIKEGRTTQPEYWNGGGAQNIVSLGGPCAVWFYQVLAGIRPDPAGPGFKKIILKPEIVGDLIWVKGEYNSIHGKIISNWEIEKNEFKWDVTIPANTTATVYIPTKNIESINESGNPIDEIEDVKFVDIQNGKAVFIVGSGCYHFSVRNYR